jgi:Flp pilus assembly protein TadD
MAVHKLFSARSVLVLVMLGLIAMFACSFAYRISHPSLVKSNRQAQNAGVNTKAETLQHIAHLMRKIQKEPDAYDLRLEAAEAFIEIEDWSGAGLHLKKALSINPHNVAAYLYMGFCQSKLGLDAEAARYYEQAKKIRTQPLP